MVCPLSSLPFGSMRVPTSVVLFVCLKPNYRFSVQRSIEGSYSNAVVASGLKQTHLWEPQRFTSILEWIVVLRYWTLH